MVRMHFNEALEMLTEYFDIIGKGAPGYVDPLPKLQEAWAAVLRALEPIERALQPGDLIQLDPRVHLRSLFMVVREVQDKQVTCGMDIPAAANSPLLKYESRAAFGTFERVGRASWIEESDAQESDR